VNLNLSALECVKVYADLLRKTIRLLTFGSDQGRIDYLGNC